MCRKQLVRRIAIYSTYQMSRFSKCGTSSKVNTDRKNYMNSASGIDGQPYYWIYFKPLRFLDNNVDNVEMSKVSRTHLMMRFSSRKFRAPETTTQI